MIKTGSLHHQMIKTTVVVIEAMVAAMADAAFVFIGASNGKGDEERSYVYILSGGSDRHKCRGGDGCHYAKTWAVTVSVNRGQCLRLSWLERPRWLQRHRPPWWQPWRDGVFQYKAAVGFGLFGSHNQQPLVWWPIPPSVHLIQFH